MPNRGGLLGLVLKTELERATDYVLIPCTVLALLGDHFFDGGIDMRWESRFGIVHVKNGSVVLVEWVQNESEGFDHAI
jgi:hypothetical protein